MSHHLIVKHSFGKYVKGQKITDPEEIARVLATRKQHVVKIAAPAGAGATAQDTESDE